MTPMSSNRSAAGVTVFEGRIYVSGGHDGLQIFNSVSRGCPGLRAPPPVSENYLERQLSGESVCLPFAGQGTV